MSKNKRKSIVFSGGAAAAQPRKRRNIDILKPKAMRCSIFFDSIPLSLPQHLYVVSIVVSKRDVDCRLHLLGRRGVFRVRERICQLTSCIVGILIHADRDELTERLVWLQNGDIVPSSPRQQLLP